MKSINFVLGGPASGKGTFCSNIIKKIKKSCHLTAGGLLREFLENSNNENKNWIIVNDCIKKGTIVPAEITTDLLIKSIFKSNNDVIFIDGFPRNFDNYNTWMNQTKNLNLKINNFILIDCLKEEMKKRLNNRSKKEKRTDDNIIEDRINVYENQTLTLLNNIKNHHKILKLNGNQKEEDIISDYLKFNN